MRYLTIKDADYFKALIETSYPPSLRQGFDPAAWFRENRGVIEQDGNCILFTRLRHSIQIHYCFKARGKPALALAKAMFDRLFSDFDVMDIFGYVPITQRASCLFSRMLGGKSRGFFKDMHGNQQEEFMLERS